MNSVIYHLQPLSNPVIQSVPTITSGNSLTNAKEGVYTCFRYPNSGPTYGIGAAHTALRYTIIRIAEPLHSSVCQQRIINFVVLPESVLQMGVKALHFLDLNQMTNPLPPELDICLVEFHQSPRLDNVPQYSPILFL